MNKNKVVNRDAWVMMIERKKSDDKIGENEKNPICRQQLINRVSEDQNCCMRDARARQIESKAVDRPSQRTSTGKRTIKSKFCSKNKL